MQRAIKFFNKYSSHDGEVDSCATDIVEILPILVADDAGAAELRAVAKRLGIAKRLTVKQGKARQGCSRREEPRLSVYADTGETAETNYISDPGAKHKVYIGFVSLVGGDLPASEKPNQDVPEEFLEMLAYDAYDYGIQDTGETVQGKRCLIKSGWHYETVLPLLGYSLEKFEKAMGIEEVDFHDSMDQCSECNLYDDESNGYTYNHRYIEGAGLLGIACGCHGDFCKANVEHFANDADHAIELDTAKALEAEGKLEHMKRAIGGWVDGRGGYFDGESCDDGDPKTMLAEALKQFPKAKFVFSHDESGQFQTYFSLWRVVPAAKAKPKAVKKAVKRPKKVAKAKVKKAKAKRSA